MVPDHQYGSIINPIFSRNIFCMMPVMRVRGDDELVQEAEIDLHIAMRKENEHVRDPHVNRRAQDIFLIGKAEQPEWDPPEWPQHKVFHKMEMPCGSET